MNRSRNSASLLRHKIGLAGDMYCMCDVSALTAFIISLLTQLTDYWTCKIWQTRVFLNKFYDGGGGRGSGKNWKLHTRSSAGVIQYHLIAFTGVMLIFYSWWPDSVFLFCFSFLPPPTFLNRLSWHFIFPIYYYSFPFFVLGIIWLID